ncbi:MAG TPA: protein kinase, partial [Burkholderiales bacterium]
LGSGGMGVVWLAHRSDGLIARPVALKLPHGAWRRAGLAERMAREREILASLAHPHIARLYDAGVTAEGQPWLAIEYIEGLRVDEYCRVRALDVRARLELFAQAANAVAYAHGKLVVHRDLKPANILVTADGQVHLLDFGIAKLLEDGAAHETHFTQMTGAALTPDYASPEQILGEPLTIASDVYSLGVILYELLCEQRPYRLQRDSRGALEEAILQADPVPPSELVDARRRPAVRGDLDTIALKALRKKPADRYPTVHALLDDIQRHLERRPVLAQRDSRWYRARKFIARNQLAVASAAAVVVALVAGAIAATWQARIALRQEARAQEVQAFIASVFTEADPMMQHEGQALTATQLLLQAEQRLKQRTDVAPALRVEMLTIIGESLIGLQAEAEGARVLENALRLQSSQPEPDAVLTTRLHLALTLCREAEGELDAASAELAQAFAALKSAPEAGALAVRVRLEEAALGLSTTDYDVTERAARQAIDEASALLGPRSDEAAQAMMFLSKAYLFTDRATEAATTARQGLELLLANHDHDYAHPKLIEYAPYYANALIHVGDYDAGADLMRTILVNAKRIYGAGAGIVDGIAVIGAPAEMERGELDMAISLARDGMRIFEPGDPDTPIQASRLRLLGLTLLAARQDDEAIRTLQRAVTMASHVGNPASARVNLGLALTHAGRLEEADEQLRLALENTKPDTYHHARAMRNRGTWLRYEGRSREAIPLLEQAVAYFAKERSNRGDHAVALVELALARLESGELDAADQDFVLAGAELDELQKQRMT